MANKTLRYSFVVVTVFLLSVFVVTNRDSFSGRSSNSPSTLAADVAAGQHVWQGRNCSGCHAILGAGGDFGPDLTNVIERRDPAWLARWLADPQAVKPATAMPNLQLAAADVTGLVALFRWASGASTRQAPVADSAKGAALFKQKGCSACHRVGGRGPTGIGPDLSHIGGVPYDKLPNTPEFLAQWLDNPQAQKAATTMPRVPLTPTERDALVRYLASLR